MAKTGTILATAGTSTAIKNTVAASDPRVSNLGSVVADALAANSAKSIVVVDTLGRKVMVGPTANWALFANNFDGLDQDRMVPTETGKRTVSFNVEAIDEGPLKTALEAIVAPKVPAFSIASLVSAIEDAAAAESKSVIIVINQETSDVLVCQGTDAQIVTASTAAETDFGTLAIFEQSVESSSGPKDAFE